MKKVAFLLSALFLCSVVQAESIRTPSGVALLESVTSQAGDLTLTPVAGSDVVIDGHFEFDGAVLTALTDNDTTITAYAGKGIVVESVDFDGGLMTVDGLVTLKGSEELADDATYALPTAATGVLRLFVEGDNEYASYHIQDDGTPITASVLIGDIDSNDTDAKLCVYDGGTGAVIKNRLGATKTIAFEFIYK